MRKRTTTIAIKRNGIPFQNCKINLFFKKDWIECIAIGMLVREGELKSKGTVYLLWACVCTITVTLFDRSLSNFIKNPFGHYKLSLYSVSFKGGFPRRFVSENPSVTYKKNRTLVLWFRVDIPTRRTPSALTWASSLLYGFLEFDISVLLVNSLNTARVEIVFCVINWGDSFSFLFNTIPTRLILRLFQLKVPVRWTFYNSHALLGRKEPKCYYCVIKNIF